MIWPPLVVKGNTVGRPVCSLQGQSCLQFPYPLWSHSVLFCGVTTWVNINEGQHLAIHLCLCSLTDLMPNSTTEGNSLSSSISEYASYHRSVTKLCLSIGVAWHVGHDLQLCILPFFKPLFLCSCSLTLLILWPKNSLPNCPYWPDGLIYCLSWEILALPDQRLFHPSLQLNSNLSSHHPSSNYLLFEAFTLFLPL